jgi:signal transduction histidine kinase
VETLSATAQDVVKSIGNIVWALNPDHDELSTFLAYTREYSSGFLRSAGIKYTIAFPDNVPLYHLSPIVRRNVFLIIKEALHNTVKHAEAEHVEIRLTLEHDSLTSGGNISHHAHCTLLVRDNGCGMKSLEGRRFGNGMKTMRRRVEEIGGTFDFQSEFQQGTAITVGFVVEGEQGQV